MNADCNGTGVLFPQPDGSFTPCPGCINCHKEMVEYIGGPWGGQKIATSISDVAIMDDEWSGLYEREGKDDPMVWRWSGHFARQPMG